MDLVKKLMKNKQFVFFSILALIVVLIAIFAPWIAVKNPYDAIMTDSLIPPGEKYMWGTDRLGRDIFSRIVYGIKTIINNDIYFSIRCIFNRNRIWNTGRLFWRKYRYSHYEVCRHDDIISRIGFGNSSCRVIRTK